jgi:hypothetical protein
MGGASVLPIINKFMVEEHGAYFVGMCIEMDDENIVFPIKFQTKDYKEALILASCIADGDPRKRVMYADIDEDYYEDDDI